MAKKKKSNNTSSVNYASQIADLKVQNENYKAQLTEAYDYDRAQEKLYQMNMESAGAQMDFQDYMSSTAHQREVADLQAAGLNPILSANNGAAAGMGAYASVDSSPTSAKFQDKMNKDQMANARFMNKYNTDVGYKLGIAQAGISAAATKAAAAMSAGATMYAANQARAASEYGSKLSYDAQLSGQKTSAKTAALGYLVDVYKQGRQIAQDKWNTQWKTKYPDSYGGIVGSAMYGLDNGFGIFGK